MILRTRFAPSPTGLLHVGNAYSALQCSDWALANSAELLLRIEDIDHTRCRPQYIDAIIEDLAWLGLTFTGTPRIQSAHLDDYRDAIATLHRQQLIYPCFCTRRSIQQEIARMAIAPHAGENEHRYPGTCRHLSAATQQQRMRNEPFAWRLDHRKAISQVPDSLRWHDFSDCKHHGDVDDDVVIGRKDIAVSYHLSVVVDDAIQKITHIIRGIDLLDSTPIHRLLQQLLKLPEPRYFHHGLLCNEDGQRLAKRNHATTLKSLREAGVAPEKLRRFLQQNPPPNWPDRIDQRPEKDNPIMHQLGNC